MDAEEANKFINSLVKNLQVLCHGHVHFNSSIQVIGHLYLNVDSNVNIDYIVNEKVCKSDTSSTVFVSKSYHSEPQKKSKLNEKPPSQPQDRRPSQSDSNVDLTNEQNLNMLRGGRSERPSFPHNFGDGRGHKTSTPIHIPRKFSAPGMEGPASKMPRLSSVHSTHMSPSSFSNRNSQQSNIKLENRDLVEDNSSHHIDTSRLQQSNISETSFHSLADSRRNVPSHVSDDSNTSKASVKEEPFIQIDLSNIKDEPDDVPEDAIGDMSNDEFLSSLQERAANIYPVGLHSNSAQSSHQFDMQNFNLPVSFQQVGAGAGPSVPGSMSQEGASNVTPMAVDVNRIFATRKRTFISNEQKRELCLFSEANMNATSKQVVEFFDEKFGVRLAFDTLSKILKSKDRWLSTGD